MQNNKFFETQTALTSEKTKIFEEYITGYLPKLLMSFGKCLIVDLFCGPGRNGDKKGSPLILLDRLKYILTSPHLQKKRGLKVYILFNDQSSTNIENLKKELDLVAYDEEIINIIIKNEKYEDLLPELVRKPERQNIPKFFFLDPFTYSNVKMKDLQKLMSLSYTEVLLFIPVFHSYRFACASFEKDHKTRKFIEEFTTEGMSNYETIHPFMSSIKSKLVKEIKVPKGSNIPYVRYILLDGGSSKNSLFLITGHQKGMLWMNKIAFKITDDGNCLKIKDVNQNSLFSNNETSNFFILFKQKLIDYIEKKQELTNKELIDYTVRECFLPKDAKQIIKELHISKKVCIFAINNEVVKNSGKWGISDDPKKETLIKWIGDEWN